MTLNFQNKLVFPAPENSYTVLTSIHQVLYIPRDIMKRAERKNKLDYPSSKTLVSMAQQQYKDDYKKQRQVEKLAKR